MTNKAKELSLMTKLLNLFEQRELAYSIISDDIAGILKPTVFVALDKLFGVNNGATTITWLDISIDITSKTLYLVGILSYHPDTENLPPIIDKLAPLNVDINENEVITHLQRVLKIGIPLTLIFKEPTEIFDFLSSTTETLDPMSDNIPYVKVDADTGETLPLPQNKDDSVSLKTMKDFNSSELSKEQISQLLFFQQITKGTKH